jgi:hypothetical protein
MSYADGKGTQGIVKISTDAKGNIVLDMYHHYDNILTREEAQKLVDRLNKALAYKDYVYDCFNKEP